MSSSFVHAVLMQLMQDAEAGPWGAKEALHPSDFSASSPASSRTDARSLRSKSPSSPARFPPSAGHFGVLGIWLYYTILYYIIRYCSPCPLRASALAAASGTGGGSIFVPILISFSYLQDRTVRLGCC